MPVKTRSKSFGTQTNIELRHYAATADVKAACSQHADKHEVCNRSLSVIAAPQQKAAAIGRQQQLSCGGSSYRQRGS
jgi:hypothetical protein